MAEPVDMRTALLAMKCSLCGNVLSVPPIISLSEDGTQLKCGSCKDIVKPSAVRNLALENMAKFFSFPCIYKDCNKLIPWKKVEIHEDSCDKKTMKCPMHYHKCDEIVMVQNLKEHMENNHRDNIFYESLTTVMRSDSCQIMVVISSTYQNKFLIMIRTISPCVIYVTSLNNTDECFEYDLKLSSIHKDQYYVLIENQTIIRYIERDHCFACIRNTCDLAHHPHSRVNGNVPVDMNYQTINLLSMERLLVDISEIKFTMTFHPKGVYGETDEKLYDDKSATNNQTDGTYPTENCGELLRRQLECPICMKYMIGKIYNCRKGHVMCKACRVQMIYCPSCRIKLDDLRNHPLENLADAVVLACTFSKNGCHFVGKWEFLLMHELECGHR
ncbi:unnamed protein product [Phaedon cochleariae]|uniref:RING-type domain-containing protein n=1 Tax=Phaedon cochleariae TaxID=80249 RepID=A0A9P0DNB3_PHACE|nr:unnamed protein product [Phaedon cochleariae]